MENTSVLYWITDKELWVEVNGQGERIGVEEARLKYAENPAVIKKINQIQPMSVPTTARTTRYTPEDVAELADTVTELKEFFMDEKYVEEIPEKLRRIFKEKKAQNYSLNIVEGKTLKEQNLSREAISILAVLNYNYWCKDEDRKKELLQRYSENEKRHQIVI